MPLSSVVGAVFQPVSLVLGRGLPVQMDWADTALMTFAARMGCFVRWRWRRAVYQLANVAMGIHRLSIDPDRAVSIGNLAEWPRQAFVASVVQGYVVDEAQRLAIRRPPTKRITMLAEAMVMRVAVSIAVVRLAAIWNRA
jgi:hypothetical protein